MMQSEHPKRSRTRTGCRTCRRAGYKCDEARPGCGRCGRLRLQCPGYGPQYVWRRTQTVDSWKGRNRSKRETREKGETGQTEETSITQGNGRSSPVSSRSSISSFASSDQSTILPAWISPSGLPHNMDLGDYRLLCHWSNVLSSLLSVAPTVEENPFHQHLTPMVNDAAGPLRYTVLFMAAEHLAALHGQQSWETQTLHYHNLAIRSLSEALQDPNEAASDSTLATVLLMQLSTYFASDQDPRASHLVAAECIIRKRWSSSSWDSPCWRFLLSLFRYRDIMSSISDGSRPLLYGYAAAAVESEQLLGGITSLLELISQISVLQSQKKSIMTTADDEPSDFPFLAVASALETELGRWTAPSSEPDWVNTAEAYRHATFIYLYRVIYNIGTPHPVTIRHVQRCRDALRAVPVESPLTSVHVWPLFTAGCESSDLADRAFYRQRLKDMYDHRKLRSLARVRMAMEDVWVQKDTEAQRGLEHVFQLDCIDVLKQRGRVIELG